MLDFNLSHIALNVYIKGYIHNIGLMPRSLELHGLLGTLPDILEQSTVHKHMKLYAPPNPESIKTFQFVEEREPTPSVPLVRHFSLC